MNSPTVRHLAPSTEPALELIALAQLPPVEARLRLRALLLSNPNHFGSLPSTSFSAVLDIQQDTTYESISCVGYDTQLEQLHATLNIWQPIGYSGSQLLRGSTEYIRFYISSDGGSKWLDQGMRIMNLCDSRWSGPSSFEITLQATFDQQLRPSAVPLKVRAILSWNGPPPSGHPAWIPNWGNVLESELALNDAQTDSRRTLDSVVKANVQEVVHRIQSKQPMQVSSSCGPQHLESHSLPSTKMDPQHRFLAYVLAKAAGYYPLALRVFNSI